MHLKSPFPPLPPFPATNFHNVVFKRPGQRDLPDHVMQIDAVTGQKRTRAEFIERMYDGATALSASTDVGGLGLTPNDVVGILSDNCLEYAVLIHSLLVITTPFALFSSYATPREMSHALTKSKATHVFVHASHLHRLLSVAHTQDFPEDHIYILEGQRIASSPPSLEQILQRVRDNRIPRAPVRQAGNDTLAYLIFSSGTSGLPKAVMISHGNLNFTVLQGAMQMEETAKVMNPSPDPNVNPVSLSFLPFFHSYGLHWSVLKAPLRVGTHVVMPRWNLDMALTLIPKYRVTALPLIPSIIHQLVNSPKFAEIGLSSVANIYSGAAYLPPKLAAKLKSLIPTRILFNDGYGLSEATTLLIVHPLPGILEGRVEYAPGSSGVLNPGLEGLILRADGTHCLPGEPGELYVKGGNIALGYWGNPEATKQTFLDDGWLRTGDIFKANTRGTLWFEDRAKDTLKVSGMQVSPAEIEDVILAEPSGIVEDVAVAGVPAPTGRTSDDRTPRAWVVLSPSGRQMGEEKARETIERLTRDNLSKYKWLRGGIQFVSEIPKNATGKVLRRVLQDQHASESEASLRAKL